MRIYICICMCICKSYASVRQQTELNCRLKGLRYIHLFKGTCSYIIYEASCIMVVNVRFTEDMALLYNYGYLIR